MASTRRLNLTIKMFMASSNKIYKQKTRHTEQHLWLRRQRSMCVAMRLYEYIQWPPLELDHSFGVRELYHFIARWPSSSAASSYNKTVIARGFNSVSGMKSNSKKLVYFIVVYFFFHLFLRTSLCEMTVTINKN